MMVRACKLKAFPGVPEAEAKFNIQIVYDVFVFVCVPLSEYNWIKYAILLYSEKNE